MVHKVKRKRNKFLVLLLLPALLVIGILGWFMYSIDKNNDRPTRKTLYKPAKDDNLTFIPNILEDQPEIVNE